MTLEETNNCEIIDELIRQGRSFAMYRNPGEEEPHFLMQTCGEVHLIRKMEDLNGRTGFVIAPFRVTPQCPIILIRPDCHEIPSCAGNLHTPAQGDDAASYGQQLRSDRSLGAKKAYEACFDVICSRGRYRTCRRYHYPQRTFITCLECGRIYVDGQVGVFHTGSE